MIVLYPIKLKPSFKDYLWGGKNLKYIYNKNSEFDIIAESWELSDRDDGMCYIENGEFKGMSLKELLEKNPGFIGRKYIEYEKLPGLIKFIDASKELSIQVHPSDETADKSENEEGKAEMWYIVKSEPGAFIYYGLNSIITKEKMIEMAENGSICNVLNKVKVNAGDIYYILPGTIHAIGKGIVIAEIQQNSNTTFRVYDYNRTDKDGKKRPLHIKRAVEVIDFEPIVPENICDNNRIETEDFSFSNIFQCNYFKVAKVESSKKVILNCGSDSFHSLLFLEGFGKIVYNDKEYEVSPGDSYFIPAGSGAYEGDGKLNILLTTV